MPPMPPLPRSAASDPPSSAVDTAAEPGAVRLDTRTLHHGRVLDLALDRVRLPNGRVMEFELVRHRGAAAVVPLLAAPDGGAPDVLLLRQLRYATGGWLLEVPAGTLDAGEEPAACALREVEEETGYRAAEVTPLGWIWSSPGFCDERIWLFAAHGLEPAAQRLDDDEVLSVVRMPLAAAVAKAVGGELHDGKSVAALLRCAARRDGAG
jgi:ADP-ribose diphosphatase